MHLDNWNVMQPVREWRFCAKLFYIFGIIAIVIREQWSIRFSASCMQRIQLLAEKFNQY